MAPHSSTFAWKIPWMEEPGPKSRTRLSDFTFTFHFHALEKEMATHSSVLAWRIPGTMESGGLPSMGSHRVRHDWSDFNNLYVTWPSHFIPTDWPCNQLLKTSMLKNHCLTLLEKWIILDTCHPIKSGLIRTAALSKLGWLGSPALPSGGKLCSPSLTGMIGGSFVKSAEWSF